MSPTPRLARPENEEPATDDPSTARDRIYAELRSISAECQRLAHRADRAAIRLATLPIGKAEAE